MINLLEMMVLLKNFPKHFDLNLKKSFLSCVSHSFDNGELCTSQIQAIVKLIEKKAKVKD